MERTGLGLTKIDPGESPWSDGGSFFGRNQDILDHLARLGALTHRHDAHAPLGDPTTAPTAVAAATGGSLPSDAPVNVAFTAIDDQGGETLLSPTTTVDTPPPAGQPAASFTGTPNYTAGNLPAGTYYYALTATDGAGGETPPSDPVQVIIAAGHANGQVQLAGLTAAIAGAAGWRLYRSANGSDYGLLASGSTDTYTDDCSDCADTTLPPPDDLGNSASSTAMVTVTVPTAVLPAGAASYRIYVSLDPTFPNPSLFGEFAAADAGTAHDVTTLVLEPGQPPAVSTSVGGAAKITLADLAADVTAPLFSGGGGGGGGGGALKLLPPESITQVPMARGPRINDYAITFDNTWALYTRLAQDTNWGTGLDIGGGDAAFDYNATQYDGDTASFAMTASAGNLTTVGTPTGAQVIVAHAAALDLLGTDGYAEFDYTISGNGWDQILVGVADNTYPTNGAGVAALIDRAAGTLSLVSITSIDPLTYDVLASYGAADGYTPPAIGDTGTLYFQQWVGRVWAVDTRFGVLMLDAAIPSSNSTAGGGNNRGLLGASWTVAGDLKATYAGFYKLAHRRQVVVADVQIVDRSDGLGPVPEVVGNVIHTLAAEGNDDWTAATFENGWTGTLGWRKPPAEPLEMYGSVSGGTAGTPIFTLPASFDGRFAFRPSYPVRVPVVTDAGPSYVEIGTDGTVTPPAGAGNTRIDFAVAARYF